MPSSLAATAIWSSIIIGEDAYSYVFDGQLGYLDHALAMTNSAMSGEISGATVWHINADEPSLIDYDMSFKTDCPGCSLCPGSLPLL